MCQANGEDLVKADFIEVRPKPKLYICKFKGSAREFSEWANGRQIYDQDGLLRTTSGPHLRTWVLGRVDAGGNASLENDYQKILAYYIQICRRQKSWA